jgi:hypothetical protein
VLTAVQVVVAELVLFQPVPATQAVHPVSLDAVAEVVTPEPAPQVLTIPQVTLFVLAKV